MAARYLAVVGKKVVTARYLAVTREVAVRCLTVTRGVIVRYLAVTSLSPTLSSRIQEPALHNACTPPPR